MMQYRQEQIVVETARHRITGHITLARDGYRSRISDVLNATERDFVAMTDVTVENLDGSVLPQHHAFLVVNRHQIVLALLPPEEEPPPVG